MTISRHWKGVAKPEEADHYIDHLRTDTFPKLGKIDGFISASILRRSTGAGIEFLIVTTWRSLEAIRQFAGGAAQTAVVPPEVQAMMVDFDREAVHYEIIGEYSR
jgi:Antibiotic biosynthesis monooxygenase